MKKGLNIFLALFLIVFSLYSVSAGTTNLGPNVECTESGFDTKEINEGSSRSMVLNTLSIGVASADKTNLDLKSTIITEASFHFVTSSFPSQPVLADGRWYTMALISASDTSATIKLIDNLNGEGDTKEINEGSSMKVNGVVVFILEADETSSGFSATTMTGTLALDLSSDDPRTHVKVNDQIYSIELVSASDTSATIMAAFCEGEVIIEEVPLSSCDSNLCKLYEGGVVNLVSESTPYEIFIEFIDSTGVKLNVNGEITNKLAAGETFRLSDGSKLDVVEINTQDYQGGLKFVRFVISGNGNLSKCDENSCELYEGETVSLQGYEIFIEFMDSVGVKLNINGEVKVELSIGDILLLSDNSKIHILEINTYDYPGEFKFIKFLISSSILSNCINNSCKLYEGETLFFNISDEAYKAFIEFIDSTSVKLNINGVVTSRLSVGETFKLYVDEDTYVEITEVNTQDYEGGLRYAKFIIVTPGEPIVACSQDVKICDDGTFVSRNPELNCAFNPCPISGERVGYRFAYWQCQDGEEVNKGSLTSCKSPLVWKSQARDFCENKCDELTDDKLHCGLSSFSVSVECDLGGGGIFYDCIEAGYSCTSELKCDTLGGRVLSSSDFACPSTSSVCCVLQEDDALTCRNSCPFEDNCLPIGYRQQGEYCSGAGAFKEQLKAGQSCDNFFECSSNVCVSGECVSTGLIERILDFLRGLFGIGDENGGADENGGGDVIGKTE